MNNQEQETKEIENQPWLNKFKSEFKSLPVTQDYMEFYLDCD